MKIDLMTAWNNILDNSGISIPELVSINQKDNDFHKDIEVDIEMVEMNGHLVPRESVANIRQLMIEFAQYEKDEEVNIQFQLSSFLKKGDSD